MSTVPNPVERGGISGAAPPRAVEIGAAAMTQDGHAGQRHVLFAYKTCEFGGGAEKNLIEVAEHVATRHRVSFVFAGGYIDPRLSALGPVHRFPGRGRLAWCLIDLVFLAYVLRRDRIDLMHAHHRYPAFLASLLRRWIRFRVLTTVHNRFPDKARMSLWGDRAIAVSQGVAEWLVRDCGVDAARVSTIHNGIQPPLRHDAARLRALGDSLELRPDVPVLLSVGRLTRQKNYASLLRALAVLPTPDWQLLVVGEGEERTALVDQAAAAGLAERVRFLGHRRDVDRLMQRADVFVMSSAWEGFPYVIVEALANGLPIVATDVGGVAEGVVDGETGFLVAPGDERALAERIGRLLRDAKLRAKLADNCVRLFDRCFRDEEMLRRTDREYDLLLAPRS